MLLGGALTASGALSSKTPLAVVQKDVGKFLSIEDAAILAQINRAGRAGAKTGKALDEKKTSGASEGKEELGPSSSPSPNK